MTIMRDMILDHKLGRQGTKKKNQKQKNKKNPSKQTNNKTETQKNQHKTKPNKQANQQKEICSKRRHFLVRTNPNKSSHKKNKVTNIPSLQKSPHPLPIEMKEENPTLKLIFILKR